MEKNRINEQTDDLESEEVRPEFPRVKTGIKAGPELDVRPQWKEKTMKEDRVEEINQTESSPNDVELQFPKVKTGIKAGPEIDIRPQ